jgi:hypothetical protein
MVNERFADLLVELSTDSRRMAHFVQDPSAALAAYGIADDVLARIVARDPMAVRQAVLGLSEAPTGDPTPADLVCDVELPFPAACMSMSIEIDAVASQTQMH